jgi:glycosyltransferase involved in cell wall biosynthesis
MSSSLEDITAIVCARNAENTIADCLRSLSESQIGSIILVDGGSTDKTVDEARRYVDKILKDPGRGLAEARNIGIAQAETTYVMNVGSDNIIESTCILKMLEDLKQDDMAGVSCMAYMQEDKNYISRAQNIYKRARFFPGEREVIGTPNMFRTVMLKENPYDPNMGHSDDGDLCMRLRQKGYKFKITNAIAYEIGFENVASIFERWGRYGISDYQTYRKYACGWSFSRKLKSLFHPIRVEIIQPFRELSLSIFLYILPFLVFIVVVRYVSWLRQLGK